MIERRVVQPAGLQLSNLAQPHIIEIAKSPSGQPAIVGLDDGQGNGPDLSAVVQESARPALLLGDQSAADPFLISRASQYRISASHSAGGARAAVSPRSRTQAKRHSPPGRRTARLASLRPVLDYPLKLARVLREEALRER